MRDLAPGHSVQGRVRTAVKLGNQTQAAYTYNADARLATSGTNAFKYNGFGERSVATVTGGGTHFIFADDGKLLSEHTVGGALVRNYIYLNGVPFAMADAAGTVSYLLNDQLGQPQKMLNTAGVVTWHRVAGIFGSTVSQPVGATTSNPLRFPGQQFDANLALHYNYYRTYDLATGRYLEADPIGLAGGMNPYGYVYGNPVNFTDPFGLEVVGAYNSTTGRIMLTDLTTLQTVRAAAESGGKPFGDPIPPGTYDILEQAGRDGFYRLEPVDADYGDDTHDPTGRDKFRLHRPGRTIGCIALKHQHAWDEVEKLIENTKTKRTTVDSKSRNPFAPSTEVLRNYGRITVVK